MSITALPKNDGHWVACDKTGHGIGDNIALVRDLEPSLGFVEAVERLTTGPVIQREPIVVIPRRTRPARLPQTRAARQAGRVYCKDEGFIRHAGSCRTLGFPTLHRGGVLFVGRDTGGGLRNVSKRLISPGPDDKPKRDLSGSDKTYPPILPGNPRVVWIVEGGSMRWRPRIWRSGGQDATNGLASGGAGVRLFLDNPAVKTPCCCTPRSVVVVRQRGDRKETG